MNALNLTFIFACCEILDIYFNHKNNVSEMLDGYVQKFKQNSVLFFAMQFSFIFLTFCVFYLQIGTLFILLIFYFLDVISKIVFIKKIENNDLDDETKRILDNGMEIPLYVRFGLSFMMCYLFYICIIW
ncbi:MULTISPECIES: hypothetical protein [Campylobacter]|uniref:hypothetical protein n=1 Tax=Campylobacter TaxID=194 RepID=UPI0023F2B607|nr:MULTISPECIES: hypothetical protein [Campylobacter]MCI6642386.1 hypothetical protein [Campylobacter sp.]MDD7422754.1 hypothetical protein [Campylobacter hominis]MDY3116533.1 hypothetical protein [Campylobacter hominis]